MKLFIIFVLAFLASACTIWHIDKNVDGSYDASHYSVGMDRTDVNIAAPDGTSIVIGNSNSSNSGDKINEGLRLIIEGAKAVN